MKTADVIVVGAGAAGLMASIFSARSGAKTLLLDRREKIGAKILMSGGTRCNLTHRTVSEKDFSTEEPIILRNILRSFDAEQALRFFESLEVEVCLEETGKYFPKTNSGRTILEALKKEAKSLGVKIETPYLVEDIKRNGLGFEVNGKSFSLQAKAIVLTTGGLSFPESGSDGTGDEIVKKLGHSMIFRSPSLVPLKINDPMIRELSGISLKAVLSYQPTKMRKPLVIRGDLLFTHLGLSGPAALDMSRHIVRDQTSKKVLILNYLPEIKESDLKSEIEKSGAKHIRSVLQSYLPNRFVELAMNQLGIMKRKSSELKKEERKELFEFLYRCPLVVTGSLGYAKAEVTAGGVPLTEVDRKNMMSKVLPGLFLAGEILDADGRIGGFNFQWAWSTGYLAGKGASAYTQTLPST